MGDLCPLPGESLPIETQYVEIFQPDDGDFNEVSKGAESLGRARDLEEARCTDRGGCPTSDSGTCGRRRGIETGEATSQASQVEVESRGNEDANLHAQGWTVVAQNPVTGKVHFLVNPGEEADPQCLEEPPIASKEPSASCGKNEYELERVSRKFDTGSNPEADSRSLQTSPHHTSQLLPDPNRTHIQNESSARNAASPQARCQNSSVNPLSQPTSSPQGSEGPLQREVGAEGTNPGSGWSLVGTIQAVFTSVIFGTSSGQSSKQVLPCDDTLSSHSSLEHSSPPSSQLVGGASDHENDFHRCSQQAPENPHESLVIVNTNEGDQQQESEPCEEQGEEDDKGEEDEMQDMPKSTLDSNQTVDASKIFLTEDKELDDWPSPHESLEGLQWELDRQSRLLASQNALLQSRRSRALGHDGHFQVMDDKRSRDNLIKLYRQLYDDTDLYSQELESVYTDLADDIEEQSPQLFIAVLKECFKSSEDQLLNVYKVVSDCARSCHGGTDDLVPASEDGMLNLVKELLRSREMEAPPRQLVDEITRRLQKVDQVKDLAAKIRLSQSASDNPTSQLDKVLLEFVRKAVVLAWFFQLLPNSFNLDAETDRKFDESRHTRHSLSEIGSETIANVFWPSLVMKKPSGEEICMFKGVVVTGAA